MDIITSLQTAGAAAFMDLKTTAQFAIVNVAISSATTAVSNAVPFGGYARMAVVETTKALGDTIKFILWNMVSNSTAGPQAGS
jgi:hypothetical protein